ncbi:MAG: DUF6922 domain-containing protein [Ignavibacteriales bacterium]
MKLPDSFSRLFENYIFETIDDDKHATLVVKTVLARGDWDQIMWLFKRYGKERVGEVFLEDYYGLRTLPESTRRLWELLLVDEAEWQNAGNKSRWQCRRLTYSPEIPIDPSGHCGHEVRQDCKARVHQGEVGRQTTGRRPASAADPRHQPRT